MYNEKWEEWVRKINRADLMEHFGPDLQNAISAARDSSTIHSLILDDKYESPVSRLGDKPFRELLINSQKKDDIEEIKKFLGIARAGNVWEIVNSSWNSKNKKGFCDFFGIEFREDDESSSMELFTEVKAQYMLFPHQQLAAKKLYDFLNPGRSRVVLHMPTGSGKTRTSMTYLCQRLREKPRKILWIANVGELCEQAASEFEKAWSHLGSRPINVCRLWGGNGRIAKDLEPNFDGLIVATIQSLASQLFGAADSVDALMNLSDSLDVIIFDEAHISIAPTYKQVLDALKDTETQLIGLTATPGRGDESENSILSDYYSSNKIRLEVEGYNNPVSYLIEEGYLSDPEFKQIDFECDIERYKKDLPEYFAGNAPLEERGKFLRYIGGDEKRNLRIQAELEMLLERDHKRVIYFAPSVKQSETIAMIMRQKGFKAFSITGNTEKFERKRLIEEYNNSSEDQMVLCNYGVLTTGFDAPRTSAALIARPTKSLVLYSQMVGRAIRGTKAGGNSKSEIVTIIDIDLPGFGDPAEAFGNWEREWQSD